MAKAHLSARIEAEALSSLDSWATGHGVTRTAAIEQAINLLTSEAIETAPEAAQDRPEGLEGENRPETHTGESKAVLEVLRASNADLRLVVSTLTAQLAVKDEQIRQAHELVDQSHRLHMAEVTRALPAEGGASRPSLWERLTGRGRNK